MANEEHLKIIKQGVAKWNQWRKENPSVQPDLNEADLRSENLAGADLSNTLLNEAKLVRASLRSANLKKADLSNAKLRWAILDNTNVIGAKLLFADLRETQLNNAKFDKADLRQADLSRSSLNNTSLNEANLSKANLKHSNLTTSKLNYANLTGALFDNANLTKAKLSHAKLNQAVLTNAQLKRADLSYVALVGADLSGASLYEAELRNAIFTGAKFVNVDFTRAIADENQFDAKQLSNKQREQLGFSVEITVKQTTPKQTGEKQAKYGEARYGQDMNGGKGGQEGGGQRPDGEDGDRFEQELAKLEEEGFKFSFETKSIMKTAMKLALKEGSDVWELNTDDILIAIAYYGKRKEREYKTAQFVLEKLRTNKRDNLEDYFNRIANNIIIDKEIRRKELKRTGYVGDALREAKKFAASTTDKKIIQIRHLLAALLFFRAVGKATRGAHSVIEKAGIELLTFMREFKEFVTNKFKEDNTEAWEKIFSEKISKVELKESTTGTGGDDENLSKFMKRLNDNGRRLCKRIIERAGYDDLRFKIEVPTDSYINLKISNPQRTAVQLHRWSDLRTSIALAIAGTTIDWPEPQFDQVIKTGNIESLSGYLSGNQNEIRWLKGRARGDWLRYEAEVYIIEPQILEHEDAWKKLEDLLRFAKENAERKGAGESEEGTVDTEMEFAKDTETPTRIVSVHGNVPTIQIEGIGEKDRLGREKLVKTMAGMFAQTECDNGLTMALLGDWGQGKSTLMGLLQTELEEKHKGKFVFAPYNAWEYEKTENVSAGIAQEVVKGLTGKMGEWKRIVLRVKFAWREHNEKLRWLIVKILIILVLLVVSLGVKLWLKNEPSWSAIIPWALGGGAISLPLLRYKELKRMFEHPLSTQLETYLKLPDYGEHLGLVPVLKRHIKTLWDFQFDEQKKLIVFVDDLDRCNVDHIVKVLDAIRLVMTIPNVIVMIGIDHRIAFKAIGKHYEELADGNDTRGAGEIARDYLGKIIQLPLRLRAASHGELKDYVFEKLFDNKNIVNDTEPEEPRKTEDPKEQDAHEEPTPKGGRPTGGGEEKTESETTGSEKDIAEAIKDKASERSAFYELVGKFGFSNPRQLLRLHNSFRFLKGYGRGKGEGYDTLDMLRMLFWQEFLHNWPLEVRHACMAVLIDEVHSEKVNPIARRVMNKVREDVVKLFNEPENYAELAEFVRIVVLPHNEEGIIDTKEEINEWLKKQPETVD